MTGNKLNELDFIEQLRVLCGTGPESLNLQDDVACIPAIAGHDWLISVDAIQRGRHFSDRDTPQTVARRLVGSAVSDLIAKGASPKGCLMTLGRDSTWDDAWLMSFAQAFASEIDIYGMSLWGGDTVRANGFASLTVHGIVSNGQMVRRSGAQAGDDIYVTGTIGDGYLGRLALMDMPNGPLLNTLNAYTCPRPPLAFSAYLSAHASASIDISDGLASDLDHICNSSHCGMEVLLDHIPLSRQGEAFKDTNGYEILITAGDDYQTAFTANSKHRGALVKAAQATQTRLSRIGVVRQQAGDCIFKSRDGSVLTLAKRGYKHF